MPSITINGIPIQVEPTDTILTAAVKADIYIPTLCGLPGLSPQQGSKPQDAIYQNGNRIEHDHSARHHGALEEGCGLCVVEVTSGGLLQPACVTQITAGMEVRSDSAKVDAYRKGKLSKILADHPHACLTCAQREGCARTQCSMGVPEIERCCVLMGNCELQKVAEFIGIGPETPRWIPPETPVTESDTSIERNYSLCVGCTRCVRACRDLSGAEALGFVIDRNGRIRVGTVAENITNSGCTFCGACAEVCPTGAITDRRSNSAGKTDPRSASVKIGLPTEPLQTFTKENVEKAPASEGVFRLMDEHKNVVVIKGAENIRKMLEEELSGDEIAKFFDFVEDKMYSQRESELIQRHVNQYGEMPGSGLDDDDLFD